MNDFELNAILYYADYLSLKLVHHPVTENCKYFYVHGIPMNASYIVHNNIMYDDKSPYFLLSYQEYNMIKSKFGEPGIASFVEDICSIRAAGSVDAEAMLRCIHLFSTRHDRNVAFKSWRKWKSGRKYYHTTINDDGDLQTKECTRYVLLAERSSKQ